MGQTIRKIGKGIGFLSLIFVLQCIEGQSSKGNEITRIPNPGFEEKEGKHPKDWIPIQWSGKPKFNYVLKGRNGGWCIGIASQEGADAGFQVKVPVKIYSRYRVSGWIKTENLEPGSGKGALLNLHNMQPLQSQALTDSQDWTRVELEFDSEGNDVIQINCLFGGWGMSRGKAWFDDLDLELISTKDLKPSVTIDGHTTQEPISKYIYGQFIEHLGRCIYGGIWAEMLEDRKFYHAVGSKKSPWRILGEKKHVSMTRTHGYVGEHTPEILLGEGNEPCGIAQEGLGLVKGKEYKGRIVISDPSGTAQLEVRLLWGDEEKDREIIRIETLQKDYAKIPFCFESKATTENGRMEILGFGKGILRIGAVSLMPADNIRGWRMDTIRLMKELKAPIYRWPGGNFVSGYDWKDGIGDPDQRPPRKNPAWKGIEHNDVGIHEFIDLCQELKAEPLITINTGLGKVQSAVEEVEYANSAPDTLLGKMRAENGHPEPFHVKWWCIGNEMYGSWQLGHMPLKAYIKKHNQIVEAIRRVDPSIQCIAVGQVGQWSQGMLSHCAQFMELISEHFYCQEGPGLLSHVAQIPREVRRIAEAHREYRKTIEPLQDKDIRIAMDEWNYWYGPYVYGELGTRYFLKDALGIAAGLHEFFRNTDIIFMANYAQTVNVIGCIKTDKTNAQFATTGQVLKLYRNRYGSIPIEVQGTPEPLDVAAAWTENKKALTLAVVNPTKENHALTIDLKNAALSEKGIMWMITGPDEMAYNEPGKEPKVKIEKREDIDFSDRLESPPLSIILYQWKVLYE